MPKAYVKNVIHIRDKTEAYAQDSRRGSTQTAALPSQKKHRGRSKSTSTAKGNRTLPEETTNKLQTYCKSGNSGPAKQRELRRRGQDLIENLVPILYCGKCHGHNILCLWRAAAKLVEKTKWSKLRLYPSKLRAHPVSHAARDKTSKTER